MHNILYIPHGGGPLPLLNDPSHEALTRYLKSVRNTLIAPKAILCVTAHWEGNPVHVSTHRSPDMLFDYYGFPNETYEYSYPSPGQPELAQQVINALTQAGIAATADAKRGFDHGTFVPLMLMYPEATIPIVQLSLHASLDPTLHIQLGSAIAPVLGDDILLLGSGLSFHNMRAFGDPTALIKSQRFDEWLVESLMQSKSAAKTALQQWTQAPDARYCHPREEHLLPLHVCAGAAMSMEKNLKQDFSTILMGTQVSAFAA